MELTTSPPSPNKTGAVSSTKIVTGNVRGGAGGEELWTRADSRVTAAATTTDRVADAGREWEASNGAPLKIYVCTKRP